MTFKVVDKESGTEKEISLFEKLNGINVNDKLEKKQNLSYLSWAWAVAEVKKVDPNAVFHVHEFPMMDLQVGRVIEGVTVPYLETPQGFFVKVSVTIHGQTETEFLPVMDHRNKTMEKPTAFDINKNTKRCLVKAIALHGLGLYVYAGEDLPEEEQDQQPKEQPKQQYTKKAESLPKFEGITKDTKDLIKVLAEDVATKRSTDVLDSYYVIFQRRDFQLKDLDKLSEKDGKQAVAHFEKWINKLANKDKVAETK